MVGSTSASSSSRSTARGSAVGALDPQPGAQLLDQLLGGRDADVGGEQGVLDRLPGVLVEAVAREQGEQAAAQAALRAGQPLAQPDQAGRGALGLLERRGPRLDGRLDGRRRPRRRPRRVGRRRAMTSVPPRGRRLDLPRPCDRAADEATASERPPTTAMPMIR